MSWSDGVVGLTLMEHRLGVAIFYVCYFKKPEVLSFWVGIGEISLLIFLC